MKFRGKIGYGESVEDPPESGVWKDVVVERTLRGDVLTATRRSEEGDKVNHDLSTSTRISLVADSYAREHFLNMRYLEWNGIKWNVGNFDMTQKTRIIVSLGGVFNGQTPE